MPRKTQMSATLESPKSPNLNADDLKKKFEEHVNDPYVNKDGTPKPYKPLTEDIDKQLAGLGYSSQMIEGNMVWSHTPFNVMSVSEFLTKYDKLDFYVRNQVKHIRENPNAENDMHITQLVGHIEEIKKLQQVKIIPDSEYKEIRKKARELQVDRVWTEFFGLVDRVEALAECANHK